MVSTASPDILTSLTRNPWYLGPAGTNRFSPDFATQVDAYMQTKTPELAWRVKNPGVPRPHMVNNPLNVPAPPTTIGKGGTVDRGFTAPQDPVAVGQAAAQLRTATAPMSTSLGESPLSAPMPGSTPGMTPQARPIGVGAGGGDATAPTTPGVQSPSMPDLSRSESSPLTRPLTPRATVQTMKWG